MAFKQTNIFPIDQQPRNAVGIAYPFSNAFDQEQLATLNFNSSSISGEVPFKLNYTTSDQLKSNIVTYFSTKKGERFLNPNYGSNVSNYLFEQITLDTVSNIEQLIKDELALNFPQINLNSVEEDTLEINFYS